MMAKTYRNGIMLGIAALAALPGFFNGAAYAQSFSKPVIILTGIVRSGETARPTSVKVSIREAGDTAREITQSTSNTETGKYLVILKPQQKYWVHLEGDSVLTKDILISTPPAQQTQQIRRDFTVSLRDLGSENLAPAATQEQN